MPGLKITTLPDGLAPLAFYPQFVIWERIPMRVYDGAERRRQYLRKQGLTPEQMAALPIGTRTEKITVHPQTLRDHNAHDTGIQTPFDVAAAHAAQLPEQYGVGFVFTERDPFFFVDVDACADPTSANGWSARANELMTRLAGASVEVSQSGTGLHIIGVCGQLPPRDCKYGTEFDLYTEGRFVALTADRVIGSAAVDCTPALTEICNTYLRPSGPTGERSTSLTTEPVPEWDGHVDDTELITHALATTSSMSAITGRASFRDLWERNEDVLARSYPDDHGGRPYDESAVDMALAQHLAFWTGKHGERILGLMYQSALVREKWDDRAEYYLPRTIQRACDLQRDVHVRRIADSSPDVPVTPPVDPETIPDNVEVATGTQMMFVPNQLEHFAGCVYVMDQDRILTPGGDLLKQSQFRAMYGGYQFVLDGENTKTTKNAWEAFTESQVIRHPKVHTLAFRPLDAHGAILTDEHDRRSVNSFTPRFGSRVAGDVTPFLDHITKLLPREHDREILLSYLAACVQYPGHKFQWCVVLQGLMGNGKTALTEPIVHALGEQYCFQLNPRDAGNVFNAWVERKLLIILEEIRVAGKYELTDALKPLITNKRVAIQGKGQDQRTGDNYANFIMFSNHRDAVMKTLDDRRYCVFYTAQQDVDHLQRDGMDNRYFRELYAYLRGGGNAAVAHYLATRPITVDVMGRAPETSSTPSAYYESLGSAEQIILEAIDMEKPGFRGDMVSSVHAGNELAAMGKRISPRAVGNMLRNIDYIIHPALEGSQGKLSVSGQRFRVFVRRGSAVAALDADGVRTAWETHNK